MNDTIRNAINAPAKLETRGCHSCKHRVTGEYKPLDGVKCPQCRETWSWMFWFKVWEEI